MLLSGHNLHTEIREFTKGHNYMKTIDKAMLPFSTYCLMTLHIYTKLQENISKRFRVIEQTLTEIYKGHNSIKVYVGIRYLFCAHCLIMFYI